MASRARKARKTFVYKHVHVLFFYWEGDELGHQGHLAEIRVLEKVFRINFR